MVKGQRKLFVKKRHNTNHHVKIRYLKNDKQDIAQK